MSEGLTEQPWTSGPRPRSVEEEVQSPGAEGLSAVSKALQRQPKNTKNSPA